MMKLVTYFTMSLNQESKSTKVLTLRQNTIGMIGLGPHRDLISHSYWVHSFRAASAGTKSSVTGAVWLQP